MDSSTLPKELSINSLNNSLKFVNDDSCVFSILPEVKFKF